jgi:hypothetical protein
MGLGSRIRDPRSGIREKPIPDPGSRGQKGTGSRIRIRNTGKWILHWYLVLKSIMWSADPNFTIMPIRIVQCNIFAWQSLLQHRKIYLCQSDQLWHERKNLAIYFHERQIFYQSTDLGLFEVRPALNTIIAFFLTVEENAVLSVLFKASSYLKKRFPSTNWWKRDLSSFNTFELSFSEAKRDFGSVDDPRLLHSGSGSCILGQCGSGSRILMIKNWKIFQLEKIGFFDQKLQLTDT